MVIGVSRDTSMEKRLLNDRVSLSLLLLNHTIELISIKSLCFLCSLVRWSSRCAWLDWEIFLCLRERKGEILCYEGFVAKRVDVKACLEICDVMPFMARCELWGLKCCDEKLYCDVFLSILRVIIMNKVLLRINDLSCDYIQWWWKCFKV